MKETDFKKEIDKIAHRLKDARIAKSMTIQDLAYMCDMERSNISRIEAGKTNFTIKTLYTICMALNIDVSEVTK